MPTVVAELARQHAARGGHTSVVVEDGLPHQPRGATLLRYPSGPVAVTRLQLYRDAASALAGRGRAHAEAALEPVIRAVPPDFDGPVLLHNALAAVAGFVRLRPRARLCLYLHNDLFRTFGRRERARVIERCALVVCVSTFVADRLTRGIRVPDGKVLVLPNGADPGQFFPGERSHDGPPVILFVGRTVRDKGAHLLVRACRRLVADGYDLRLRIVGSAGLSGEGGLSGYERRLRRSAAPLADRVEFVPFADRLAIGAAYRSADVFCAPSTCQDACPLVLSEALASGLACVVSRRGGMPEQAGDGVARLFRPRRPGDLRRALEPLVRDAGTRARYRRQAAARGAELSWSSRYDLLCARLTDRFALSHP
ncbi:glycosyltransferase family 4 protein [Rhizohabitans arisaemae]|uniref:glycosyltransferase family 4 protein n=1 Tax=Rhizohabitans arisaemae TaxID=2720610 RepID=UPI0024B0C3F5|nr:glycosyltransferase family 4 protein [Rhizohabitans arisaemae]